MTLTQATNRWLVEAAAFEALRAEHPEVEEVIADWSLAELSAGATHLSMSELWCRYRSKQGPGGGPVTHPMNDRFQAYMVRLLIMEYPELRALFRTRKAGGADSWQLGYLRRHARVVRVPRPRRGGR